MTALLAHVAALHDTLEKLDSSLSDAVAVLRECGIQLAVLQTLQAAGGCPTHSTQRLRDRIDALTGMTPRPSAQMEHDHG